MTPRDLLPPAIAAFFPPLYERALREGPFRTEYIFLNNRTLELFFNPIVVHGGTTGIFVCGKEITEQKKAENALRESESCFRRFFEQSASAMLLVEPESGKIIDSNRAAAVYYGYSQSELAGMPINQLNILPLEEITLERQRALREERNYFNFQHRLASGELRDVEVYSSPVQGDGGTLLYTIVHDVTERRQAAQALQQSESRFRRFFEENSSIMLLIEPVSGAIVDANLAASKFYGYAQEELVSMSVNQINTLPPEVTSADRQIAIQKQSSIFNYRVRLASGEEREVEVYLSPFEMDGRTLICSIVHDVTERRQAEKALRESLDSLKEAEIIGALGSYVLDLSSEEWTSSEALDRIFGIDKAYDHTLAGWLEMVHPDDREMMASYFACDVVGAGKTFDKEYRIVRRSDQAVRWVHGKGRLEFDGHGQLLKMSGIIQDITEGKLAEMQLRESEERFRATFEQAAVGIVHTSREGVFLRCNTRFAQMLGYSPEEIPGKTIQQITYPEDFTSSADVLQQLAAGEVETAHWEKRYIRKDGSLFWARITVSAQHDAEGRLLHYIAVNEDINDRKEAEQRLALAAEATRASEERYRTVFQTSLDAMSITRESDRVFLDVNDAFLSINGFERHEVIGHSVFELNLWVDTEARYKLIGSMDKDSPVHYVVAQSRKKSGEIFWGQMSSSRIDLDGVPCVFIINRDISAAKAAEKRLAEAAEALRTSEERYHTIFLTSPDAVMLTRLSDGVIIDANQAFLDSTDHERCEVIGSTALQIGIWVNESDRLQFQDLLKKNFSIQNMEVLSRRKNGELFWMRLSASLIEIGGTQCVLSFAHDITEAKAAEDQLAAADEAMRLSEARYRTVFQTSLDGIAISRLSDGRYIDVNQAYLKMMGYEREDVVGHTSTELIMWADAENREEIKETLLRDSSFRDMVIPYKRKNGEVFWMQLSASLVELDGVPCILSVTRDTTEIREAEERIKDLSFHDSLTGLPNRRLLLDRLQQAMAANAVSNCQQALLYIDLDNFKTVNDTLGHRTGDLLLQQVARRIAGCIHETDTVARLGADEFAVVLEDLDEVSENAAAQARRIAERILAVISHPYLLDGRECHAGASIGISLFGDHQQTAEAVLQQADIALHQAKAAGRNTVRFFSPALQKAVNARATLEVELHEAIKADQFLLYYQPQVEQGRVTGVEALIRWKHPARGIVLPGEFISLAEESKMMLPIGDWSLTAACAQIAAWADREETAHLMIAANISVLQFRQPDFVEQVLSALDRTGANPKNLKLELTESMLAENLEDVIEKMTELKSQGLSFSLDDFGTGYSSLAYLKRLPLDQLKIDRAFVRDMLVDATSGAIARAILSLGMAMGLSVMAEGVETEEQRGFLTGLGCHSFQGYLISYPLPLEEFETFLAQYPGGSAHARR
jgi:diguanylate cyclase (GGDEF)-like protein/PAS domain S-box-containing protein